MGQKSSKPESSSDPKKEPLIPKKTPVSKEHEIKQSTTAVPNETATAQSLNLSPAPTNIEHKEPKVESEQPSAAHT